MDAAVERRFVEAELVQYGKHRFLVPRLSAVGSAEDGQLALLDAEAIDCSRQHGRHDLERLRRRPEEDGLLDGPERKHNLAVRPHDGSGASMQAADKRAAHNRHQRLIAGKVTDTGGA
jgi:hypothetical protein